MPSRLSVCPSVRPSVHLSVNNLVSTFSSVYILSLTKPNKFIFGIGILKVFPGIKLIFMLSLSLRVKVKGHFKVTWFDHKAHENSSFSQYLKNGLGQQLQIW